LAAFSELDWRRIDVWAIVGFGGLAVLNEGHRLPCHTWLERNSYDIDTLDCRQGISEAVSQLGHMLKWKTQFGYALAPHSRNLDALRDGFDFDVSENRGRVFEILGAELAWQEDTRWLIGLLSIAQERSRWHLALGKRFFALLVLPEHSQLIGKIIDVTTIPSPFSDPNPEMHEFTR
jgi:hypothetical protein